MQRMRLLQPNGREWHKIDHAALETCRAGPHRYKNGLSHPSGARDQHPVVSDEPGLRAITRRDYVRTPRIPKAYGK